MADIAQDATSLIGERSSLKDYLWKDGLFAAATWFLAAAISRFLPDVVVWGDTQAFALLTAIGGTIFLVLAVVVPRLPESTRTLVHYGPWFIAIGIWFSIWS